MRKWFEAWIGDWCERLVWGLMGELAGEPGKGGLAGKLVWGDDNRWNEEATGWGGSGAKVVRPTWQQYTVLFLHNPWDAMRACRTLT